MSCFVVFQLFYGSTFWAWRTKFDASFALGKGRNSKWKIGKNVVFIFLQRAAKCLIWLCRRVFGKGIFSVFCQRILCNYAIRSWFVVDENEDLVAATALAAKWYCLNRALIGDNMPQTNGFEMQIIEQHSALLRLMKQERVKPMRRAMLMFAEDFSWAFNTQGLALRFSPVGSYATALIRELVKTTTLFI